MGRNGHGRLLLGLTGLALTLAACTSGTSPAARTSGSAGSTEPAGTPTPSIPSVVSVPSAPSTRATTTAAPVRAHPPRLRTSSAAPTAPRTSSAQRLPLGFRTGTATQVITVVASSTSSTQGTVQAWRKVSDGWRKVGGAVPAWLGSAGLSTHTSEGLSATPIGSFTLTQAFGHDSDPGTALPYFRTTPADWWISQTGSLYNTHQRCSSGCAFTQGDPNEHLYYETPYYNYAVVIDYNTRNAPGGVRAGAGSAFFLHVHPPGTGPTAGCVSIPQGELVRIMQWLTPAAHPRIVIGVA